MSNGKHTPGPWIAHHSEHPITQAATSFVSVAGGYPIAREVHGPSPDGRKANANLIAAAPELLEALKALAEAPCSYAGSHIHIFCDSHSDAMLRMREARAAIAKATS